ARDHRRGAGGRLALARAIDRALRGGREALAPTDPDAGSRREADRAPHRDRGGADDRARRRRRGGRSRDPPAAGARAPGAAIPAAIAVECVHAFSLVHDDLPALDDDDYRRGHLTTHKKFGEAVGILAGDALLALAFEEVAKLGRVGVPPPRVVEAVSRLAYA